MVVNGEYAEVRTFVELEAPPKKVIKTIPAIILWSSGNKTMAILIKTGFWLCLLKPNTIMFITFCTNHDYSFVFLSCAGNSKVYKADPVPWIAIQYVGFFLLLLI